MDLPARCNLSSAGNEARVIWCNTSASSAAPAVGQTLNGCSFMSGLVLLNGQASNCSRLTGVGASPQEDEEHVNALAGIQLVAFVLVFVCGIVGNALVFAVFMQKPNLLTISNRYVISLAGCNFLMTLLLVPLVATATVDPGRFEKAMVDGHGALCHISGVTTVLLYSACLWTVLLITMDRFYAILKPFQYTTKVTTRKSAFLICSVWVASAVISLCPTFGWGHVTYRKASLMCTINWSSEATGDRGYTLSLLFLSFVIPYLIMVLLYTVIYKTARKSANRVRRHSLTPDVNNAVCGGEMLNSNHRRRSSVISLTHSILSFKRRGSQTSRSQLSLYREDWRTAQTAAIIMATFTLNWLPYFLVVTLETGGVAEEAIPAWVHSGVTLLVLSGCTLNPLVYVFRCKVIKDEIKDIPFFKVLYCNVASASASDNGSTTATIPRVDSTTSTLLEAAPNGILRGTARSLSLPESTPNLVSADAVIFTMAGCDPEESATCLENGVTPRPKAARSASIVTFSDQIYRIGKD